MTQILNFFNIYLYALLLLHIETFCTSSNPLNNDYIILVKVFGIEEMKISLYS